MSGRRATGTDRAVLAVLGVLLLAVGAVVVAAAAGWTTGVQIGSAQLAPGTLQLDRAVSATEAPWWPWACAGAAVVLVVLGVLWLLAHLPAGREPDLTLPGSRTGERLRVVPDAVAVGAKDRLEADPRVQGARLAVRREHGHLVLTGSARVDARVDLPEMAALVDQVVQEAGAVLGAHLAGRVRLLVARRRSTSRTVA